MNCRSIAFRSSNSGRAPAIVGFRCYKYLGGISEVDERYRHRYEVNPDLIGQIESAGLKYVGKDETGERCEIMELEGHPYFVGTQYHPEFKSRPDKPSPPYLGLLKASSGMDV